MSFLTVALAFALATPKAEAWTYNDLYYANWVWWETYWLIYWWYDFWLWNSQANLKFSPKSTCNSTVCNDLYTFFNWTVDVWLLTYSLWQTQSMSYYNWSYDRWAVSFVKISRNTSSQLLVLKYYLDNNKSWYEINVPVGWYDFEVSNWNVLNFTNIHFRHDSIIFYTSDYSHSLQYRWWSVFYDWVVYSDPYSDSDNFWLIHTPEKKAWSMTQSNKQFLSDYMLWKQNLPISDFVHFPYDKSYTISNWWSSFFPPTAWNQFKDRWWNLWWKTFLYNIDLNYSAPVYWNNNNDNIWESNFNIGLVNQYNKCVNKGENLRKSLHLAIMCKLQWEDSRENIIINTGLNYTGSYSYCLDLDNFINSVYSVYSWNWNIWLINENVDIMDYNAPFNDLIFSWYYNSVFIDENQNVSWLPVGNNWCSAYTVWSFYDNEKSTIEKISESITDFFGSGVASIYNETVWTHSTFSWLITSLSVWTSGFFTEYLFDPYIEQFNSGYNKFYSAVNMTGCSFIKQTFPDTIYWDLVFFVAVVSLIFIFIRLL